MIFPYRQLCLGLGLAAAGGVAVWSSLQKNEPRPSAKTELPVRPAPFQWFAEGPVKPLPLNASRQAVRESPVGNEDITAGAVLIANLAPIADPPVAFQATREELEFRAFMVERQATKQLKTLLGVLNLTEDQQDRIFSTLARQSEYYHPALQFQNAVGADIAAAPATTPVPSTPQTAASPPPASPATPGPAIPDPTVDPILADLAPDQIEVYERYRSERDSFWAGVVTDIEEKLNAGK